MVGVAVNHQRVQALVQSSLMLVTALVPNIEYDHATAIAKHGRKNGTTLRLAALALGTVTEDQSDCWVAPRLLPALSALVFQSEPQAAWHIQGL